MEQLFSNRILNTKKSFIREILKITQNKEVISFAGGLPNPISFPIEELKVSTNRVLDENGVVALQYSTTEGYLPLRNQICERYRKRFGIEVSPEDILITSGSQQALDLIGKVLLNKDDHVAIEKPGYLGSIQALSLFEPIFDTIDLLEDGIDVSKLKSTLETNNPKLLYTVPNFQNPTGLTYSLEKRKAVADIIKDLPTYIIEDDPYGELRFSGEDLPYMGSFGVSRSILLGSFSKVVTPGMRIGWICTKDKLLMDKLIIAKQASDLHTNFFSQCIISDYLAHNNLDDHIQKIKELYKTQSTAMLAAINEHFPTSVKITIPEGGMFLWGTLPEGCSSMEVFDLASLQNVAFVPGEPFYTEDSPSRTFRLNYTNSDPDTIRVGIERLGNVLKAYLNI